MASSAARAVAVGALRATVNINLHRTALRGAKMVKDLSHLHLLGISPMRLSLSAIAADSPISRAERWVLREQGGQEQLRTIFFLHSGSVGGQFFCTGRFPVVVLDAGAAANLVCSRWLENPNMPLGAQGDPRLSSYPACARVEFGDGRLGGVCVFCGSFGWN